MEGDPELFKGRNFSRPRDEVLYLMDAEGWANESGGATNASSGYYARISNTPAELDEVVDAFAKEIADVGLADAAELIGHFLLKQASDGYVSVHTYPSEPQLKLAFDVLERSYAEWERQR